MKSSHIHSGRSALFCRTVVALALIWQGIAHADTTLNSPSLSALQAAVATGGRVTFAFDGVITVTSTLQVNVNTILDGSGRNVTISGNNSVRLFKVASGISFKATNIVFADGKMAGAPGTPGSTGSQGSVGGTGGSGSGGAIHSLGPCSFFSCTFQNNSGVGGSGGTGGQSTGTLTVGGDGGAGGSAYGGAIYNSNVLVLSNCIFVGNTVTGGDGGVGGPGTGGMGYGWGGYGGATAGGAVYTPAGCTASIANCTFYSNWARSGATGGGTPWDGQCGQTGRGGVDGKGGAVANSGNTYLVNCTISANIATGGAGGKGGDAVSGYVLGEGGDGGTGGNAYGGNLYNGGTLGLTNCTLSGGELHSGPGGTGGSGQYTSGSTGAIGVKYGGNVGRAGGTVNLKNTILANPVNASNVSGTSGTVVDQGNNLSSDATPSFTQSNSRTNTDASLEPLANNGGATMTMALMPESAAVNAGDDTAAPVLDQTGHPRVWTSDIGACEYVPTVTLVAPGADALADGEPGMFLLQWDCRRKPLTINLSITGSASNGVDCVAIPTSYTVPADDGIGYGRILVRPNAGAFNGTKTITAMLLPNSQYNIDSNYYGAVIVLRSQNTADGSSRYGRGTSTAQDFRSFVVPLDYQTGVRLDAVGGNASTLFPGNSWTNSFYHYDTTNLVPQTNIGGRIQFQNPIVAFGSRVGGSGLYIGQNYSFGVSCGIFTNLTSGLRVQVYSRSNWSFVNTINLTVPNLTNASQLGTYVTNGFTQTIQTNGLTTVLTLPPGSGWGNYLGRNFILTHSASSAATNYYYVVEEQGYTPVCPMVLNATNGVDWSKLYVMEFSSPPSQHPRFIDQPHFDGAALPPQYEGKSLAELTNTSATLPNLSYLQGTNFLTVDASPELRRHPVLDQFVQDMRNDPMALANYVINEIDLTDAIDYDTNHNGQASISLGGISRGALATFQEGQGSPAEQCALLVYLLRQAKVPAAYIYPTNGGLQMLDTQLSKLLRVQLHGALNQNGETNLPRLITANYPWVAAYVGTNWVQIFPWIKDTEIIEGFDFYDYLPTNYNNGAKWLGRFVANDTNIFSLSTSDQPLDLLPLFIQKCLNTNAPGLSVDDIGVQFRNRRHLYTEWAKLPRPFALSGTPSIVESLGVYTNLFNTVQVRVYSKTNSSRSIDTGEMRVVDLHNRKLMLKFQQVGTSNVHNMILSLAPFNATNTAAGSFGSGDPTLKLCATNALDSSDDTIAFEVTHRRYKYLLTNYVPAQSYDLANLWCYNNWEWGNLAQWTVSQDVEYFRKGDLVTFCLDIGRVSSKMLNIQAQEIWRFNQAARTNSSNLDPDVYQGTTAYLTGMSYFNYLDRFNDLNDRLHKVRLTSRFQYGYGLIRPLRDTSGNLVSNGVVNLVTPALHIPVNGEGSVFNSTLRPDSGRDSYTAKFDWWLQFGLQQSAAEHGILSGFYGTNAVSAIKLLQKSGSIFLNQSNYVAAGTNRYHNVALKDSDPNLWASVIDLFNSTDPNCAAYITPGVVTNGGFAGVGALLFGSASFGSPISGFNGGYSDSVPKNTFSQANATNINVITAPDGTTSPFVLQCAATANNKQYLVDGWSTSPSGTYEGLQSGTLTLDPAMQQSGQALNAVYGCVNNSPSIYDMSVDQGVISSATEAHNDLTQVVYDPVSVLTGEFYVDAKDLTLPGPLNLQVRRNYSSHNQVESEFGFGWKINYMSFLALNTNSSLIFAAEMDGSVVAYRQTATNVNLWLPTALDNPLLNNNSSMGIGSLANLFNNRLALTNSSGTNVYTLTGADGSIRTFTQRPYSLGSFTRQRPYLDRWQDNRGNFFAFEYGTDPMQPDYGEVRRIQSSNGNFLGFYYDAYGHIMEAYTGDGRRLQYEYDKYGDLTTVTLPDETQVNYVYQHLNVVSNIVTNVYSTHLILQEIKPEGRIVQNAYDSQRRVTNQLSTAGTDLTPVRTASFVYSNNYNLNVPTNMVTGITWVYDYTNNVSTYYYTNSLIRKTVDPLNRTETQDWYETDGNGGYRRSLKSVSDQRGLLTSYQYDSSGNVTNTTVTGNLTGSGVVTNAVSSAVYNSNNQPTLIVDPMGNSVQYVYSSNYPYLPQQVIALAGTTAISTNFLTYTNTLDVSTNGTNMSFGLLTRSVRAYGSSDAATNDTFYNGQGFVTASIRYTGKGDPDVTNYFFYNERGELAERMDAAGRSYVFDYDPMGRPAVREIYEAGATVPMDWEGLYYNGNGELTWTDGPAYDPEDYAWRDYNGTGKLITEIHWRAQALADGSGVEAPAGDNLYAVTLRTYDLFGNLTSITDPRGAVTTNVWNKVGQLVKRTFLDTNGTTFLASEDFVYGTNGLLQYYTNALKGVTETQYTTTGKPTYRRNPDGSTNGWTYYVDGRVCREYLSNGSYWETRYDDANRRTTRTFYSSGNTPLATNVVVVDRRGNVIQRTDAANNSFTNYFDGLDRIKGTAGPVISFEMPTNAPSSPGGTPPPIQQITTNYYDAAGAVFTTANGLGEKTITYKDALGRPSRVEIRDAANALVRETTTVYSPDHHSATVTSGSGASAVSSTSYTDNDGHVVLSVGYPSASSREFTLKRFDVAGNLILETRNSVTNGLVSQWTSTSYTYDGLNRLTVKSDRDNALTYFAYDPAGNLTNQMMPGNTLTWRAAFNTAGQKLWDCDVGSGGAVTRSNTYSYYPTTGLLQTRTDGRGVISTTTYDEWLRPVTNVYSGTLAEQKLTTTWKYEARGMVTNVSENFATNTTGSGTTIRRTFDAYGQLLYELVNVGTNGYSARFTRDAAGRREVLGIGDSEYVYGWRADGLLASVDGESGSGVYTYNTGGQLLTRTVGNKSVSINTRDGIGRPLSMATTYNSSNVLIETLSYTSDGLLGADTMVRYGTGGFTDARSYAYAASSRRLTQEKLSLDGSTTWTNDYVFDGGAASGPGVLTRIGLASPSQWSAGIDGFARISNQTNTAVSRPAYGHVNGDASITVYLDDKPMPVTTVGTNWRAILEMTPGGHQLKVSADHPSGQFTALATNTFTNNIAADRIQAGYSANGELTTRVWLTASGQTNRIQTLSWDAKGRLYSVIERDATNSGFNWTAVYDGLGRRLQTTAIMVTNGVAYTAGPQTISQYFDPEIEFLELGETDNGATTWKLYGPDLNGVYGGMNGTGGFEGVQPGAGLFVPVIADANGNIHAEIGVTNGLTWYPSRVTGYGAVPGYRPLPLGGGATVQRSSAFRGRWSDISGLVWLGGNYYDPANGQFVSFDPRGHASSPSGYSYCNGDPINYFDPDGRCWEKVKTGINYGGNVAVGFLETQLPYTPDAPDSTTAYYGRMTGRESGVAFSTWLTAKGVIDMDVGGTMMGASGWSILATGGIDVEVAGPVFLEGASQATLGGIETLVGTWGMVHSANLPPLEDPSGYQGGAYRDVDANGGEVHHAPADSVSPLSRDDGPGLRMETEDHRQTASWGRSKDAQAYRQQQESLIQQGKFREAQQMDIDDIQAKFGDKYKQGIQEMLDYTDTIPADKLKPRP